MSRRVKRRRLPSWSSADRERLRARHEEADRRREEQLQRQAREQKDPNERGAVS